MSNVVPFGKYRGKPVAELTADRKYCKWLTAQPWFRENYSSIYRLVSHLRSPDDTPEHNALQARFLDPALCLATARSLGLSERVAAEMLAGQKRTAAPPTILCDPMRFEEQGWDVVLRLYEAGHENLGGWHFLWLELKPIVGDDYPSVLRQMQANMPSFDEMPRDMHDFAVVIGKFNAAGVTFDQVRAMFAASEFSVLMLSDIEAALPGAPKPRRRRRAAGVPETPSEAPT
jgi:hypothetical protein